MIKLLLLLSIAYGAYAFFTRPAAIRCGTADAVACPEPALEEGVGVTLSAAEACPRAGYLCSGRGAFQVARWPLDKGKLRVHVPLPDFVDKDTARELRTVAIEGIMQWDGHPFPLVIDRGGGAFSGSDIVVGWSQGLGGHARIRTDANGKRLKYLVEGMRVHVPPIVPPGELAFTPGTDPALVVKDIQARQSGGQEMGPALLAAVKAIAIHEMGHALGLMHSDQEGDIMFPEYKAGITRARVSARDLRAVDALYTLPNGAMVQ